VILVDANLLLYAYNPSFDRHRQARAWLEGVLSRPGLVCFAWTTILAFLRIVTNPRAFEHPLSVGEALPIVSAWLERPMVMVLDPGARHWTIMTDLLSRTQVRGPGVMDAHLAALAIEHGAVLCTSDRDFVRFPGLRLLNPLERGA
jgi:toxin-antitoxin system PIN domain toxin